MQGSHARFCRSCRHREGVTVVKPIIWVDRQPFSLIQHRTLHTLSSHLYSTTHYPLLDGKQAGLLARLFNPVRLAPAVVPLLCLLFLCLLCILFPFWGLIILSERGEEGARDTRGAPTNGNLGRHCQVSRTFLVTQLSTRCPLLFLILLTTNLFISPPFFETTLNTYAEFTYPMRTNVPNDSRSRNMEGDASALLLPPSGRSCFVPGLVSSGPSFLTSLSTLQFLLVIPDALLCNGICRVRPQSLHIRHRPETMFPAHMQ